MFHDKSKHIEIKYHYIRDMVQRGAVKLQHVVMEEYIADFLTKPLARVNLGVHLMVAKHVGVQLIMGSSTM